MTRVIRGFAKALVAAVLLVVLVFGFSALWVNRLGARARADYPPIGRFVSVAGSRLHYVEAGRSSGEAPPIVLLHGNPGSTRDFELVVPALAATHRVVAIDRPGHGYSERPDLRAATPIAQARQLHAALTQLDISRPILVGHSWGGSVALAYATEFPDDVAGVALLGTRAYPVDAPPDALYAFLRRPIIGPLLRHTLVPLLGRGILETRFTAAYRPDSVQPAHLSAARALWMRPRQLGATVWDTWLLQEGAAAMARRYSTIGAPVQLLVGDGDDLLPESQQLATQLPNAWIEVLPNTGHYLQRTRVEEVQRAIAVLSARARAPGPAGVP